MVYEIIDDNRIMVSGGGYDYGRDSVKIPPKIEGRNVSIIGKGAFGTQISKEYIYLIHLKQLKKTHFAILE